MKSTSVCKVMLMGLLIAAGPAVQGCGKILSDPKVQEALKPLQEAAENAAIKVLSDPSVQKAAAAKIDQFAGKVIARAQQEAAKPQPTAPRGETATPSAGAQVTEAGLQ